ncbi:hypothetical protein [Micromonospora sp. LH3U1]|uniref:hypothetical protein n=1 Tax=Micromonospora sp. LH3U1 TaxID=3018339 RepID=UPI003FA5B287
MEQVDRALVRRSGGCPAGVAAARRRGRTGCGGWALVLLGVALLNLAVLAALRGRDGVAQLVGRVLAGIGHVAALVGAASCALVPLILGRAAGSPLLAGLPLLLVALTGLGAAWLVGGRALRSVAAGLLVPVLAVALLRPVAELRPALLLIAAATVAVGLAAAVRLLPDMAGPEVPARQRPTWAGSGCPMSAVGGPARVPVRCWSRRARRRWPCWSPPRSRWPPSAGRCRRGAGPGRDRTWTGAGSWHPPWRWRSARRCC